MIDLVIDDRGDCSDSRRLEPSKPMGWCVRRLLMFSRIGGDYVLKARRIYPSGSRSLPSLRTLCRSAISDSVSLQYVVHGFQRLLGVVHARAQQRVPTSYISLPHIRYTHSVPSNNDSLCQPEEKRYIRGGPLTDRLARTRNFTNWGKL